MYDVSHYYGGDLDVDSTGDLALADATTTGEQRVYRRLLTNPESVDQSGETVASGDYTFHPEYGAGLGRYVGEPTRLAECKSLINEQMKLEAAVATSPRPVVTLTADSNQLSAVIQYNDAQSKTPVTVSFDVNQ
ncbi:phage tail protein [Robbsia andropogonis]|uniref:phage tail protein n=1 Tax=Robbsia andropogonis TaxID=28092 RepID=UPI003D262559